MRTDRLSYKEVAEWFTRARNPEKGRPVQAWARMFKVDDSYELRTNTSIKTVVGVFSPDNKFTFRLSPQQTRQFSYSLVSAMHRAIPFVCTRRCSSRYTITPTPQYEKFIEQNPYADRKQYLKQQKGYVLFNGLCFDLDTYEPVNAKPSLKDAVVVQENRLEWLRKLRKFKYAVKVCARIGVIDSLIEQVNKSRIPIISRSDWRQPDWDSEAWQDMLYTSIKDGECHTVLLTGAIESVSRGWVPSLVRAIEVVHELDRICTAYSLDLRIKFGVYEELKGENK